MEESIKIKNSLVDNKKMRFGTESIPKLLVSYTKVVICLLIQFTL